MWWPFRIVSACLKVIEKSLNLVIRIKWESCWKQVNISREKRASGQYKRLQFANVSSGLTWLNQSWPSKLGKCSKMVELWESHLRWWSRALRVRENFDWQLFLCHICYTWVLLWWVSLLKGCYIKCPSPYPWQEQMWLSCLMLYFSKWRRLMQIWRWNRRLITVWRATCRILKEKPRMQFIALHLCIWSVARWGTV